MWASRQWFDYPQWAIRYGVVEGWPGGVVPPTSKDDEDYEDPTPVYQSLYEVCVTWVRVRGLIDEGPSSFVWVDLEATLERRVATWKDCR